MKKDKTIFVSIPNYRDKEINPTLNSLLGNASLPSRVKVGVLTQINLDTDIDCVAFKDSSINQKIIPNTSARGCSWARATIQQELMGNEDYYLQIDSHSRFVEGWDKKLIEMHETLEKDAAISTYPSGYDLPDILHEQMYIWLNCEKHFMDKLPSFTSLVKPFDEGPIRPQLNAFTAGGFFFTTGEVARKVPCDPYIYFLGEEIVFSVRLYTHGINVYSPNMPIMWHKYNTNDDKPLHWKDNENYHLIDAVSKDRIYHILGMKPSKNELVLKDIRKYGLGTVRSLKAYQHYSGYNFKTGEIQPWCKEGKVMFSI